MSSSKRTRRGNGEGTICKRKGGKGWVSAVNIDGARRYFYGQSRQVVKDRLDEALADSKAGRRVAQRPQKLGAFLSSWLETTAGTVRAGTHEFYRWAVGHIIPVLGDFNLKQLTPSDVERFMSAKKEFLSPRSVRHLRASLRAALTCAHRDDLVAKNAAGLAKPPLMVAHEMELMSSEQFGIWKKAIVGHRLEPLFILAIQTGFRQSELLGLRWEDIDFVNDEVTVRRQLEFRKGEFNLVEPKTPSSLRTVALPSEARGLLLRRQEEQLEERRYGNRLGLVFTSGIGTPLFAKSVRSSLNSIYKRAGLPHFTFHSLRHSAATILLSRGVPIHQVAKQLGHSSPSVTLNVYGHAIKEDRRKAADAFTAHFADAAAAPYVVM